jgi:hypothetical protein
LYSARLRWLSSAASMSGSIANHHSTETTDKA